MAFVTDISRAVYIYSNITHAVREAARFGSVDCSSTTKIINRVHEMSTFPVSAQADCDTTDSDDIEVPGYCTVTVKADYIFKAATPFIDKLFPNNNIIIHVESEMHQEFMRCLED
jgi:hypothetical protein